MEEPFNPLWEATLEESGVEAVRREVSALAGYGSTSVIQTLTHRIEAMPTLGYAGRWVEKKDAEVKAARERQNAKRDLWARGLAVIAILVSALSAAGTIFAWIFPRKP